MIEKIFISLLFFYQSECLHEVTLGMFQENIVIEQWEFAHEIIRKELIVKTPEYQNNSVMPCRFEEPQIITKFLGHNNQILNPQAEPLPQFIAMTETSMERGFLLLSNDMRIYTSRIKKGHSRVPVYHESFVREPLCHNCTSESGFVLVNYGVNKTAELLVLTPVFQAHQQFYHTFKKDEDQVHEFKYSDLIIQNFKQIRIHNFNLFALHINGNLFLYEVDIKNHTISQKGEPFQTNVKDFDIEPHKRYLILQFENTILLQLYQFDDDDGVKVTKQYEKTFDVPIQSITKTPSFITVQLQNNKYVNLYHWLSITILKYVYQLEIFLNREEIQFPQESLFSNAHNNTVVRTFKDLEVFQQGQNAHVIGKNQIQLGEITIPNLQYVMNLKEYFNMMGHSDYYFGFNYQHFFVIKLEVIPPKLVCDTMNPYLTENSQLKLDLSFVYRTEKDQIYTRQHTQSYEINFTYTLLNKESIFYIIGFSCITFLIIYWFLRFRIFKKADIQAQQYKISLYL